MVEDISMRRLFAIAGVIGAVVTGSAQTPLTFGAPANASFYGLTPQFAVSPDGQQIVYVVTPKGGQTRLWLHTIGTRIEFPMVGTEQASYPFWSADSRSIGFFASGKLVKIAAVANAKPEIVCDAPTG